VRSVLSFELLVFIAFFEEGSDRAEEVGDRVDGFVEVAEQSGEDEEPD
jgi:hypothetical protein